MKNTVQQLVYEAKKGDSIAFSKVYALFSNDLYRFAYYYLGNSYDAEDAVQDALIQAFIHISDLKKAAAFQSWMFKILSNCCKTKLANSSKNPAPLCIDEIAELVADDSNGEDIKLSLELKDAIFRLSEEERSIVLMSVIGGYKSFEIAKILDCPPSTIRSKLSRSLAKLKAFFD